MAAETERICYLPVHQRAGGIFAGERLQASRQCRVV